MAPPRVSRVESFQHCFCERCVSSSSSLGTCARRCRRVMHACVCSAARASASLSKCALLTSASAANEALNPAQYVDTEPERQSLGAPRHPCCTNTTPQAKRRVAERQDGPPPAPAHPQTTSETQRPQISTKVASYERRDVVAEGHVQHSLYCRFWTHSDETSDEGRGAVCCS